MTFDLDLSQMNRLSVDMAASAVKAKAITRVAVQKSSADIKRDAQMFAPVDTGNLRSSISYETRELASAVEGIVGPTAEYGVYVELGTARMAPQAFMGPAFDRNAAALEKALEQIADGLL